MREVSWNAEHFGRKNALGERLRGTQEKRTLSSGLGTCVLFGIKDIA